MTAKTDLDQKVHRMLKPFTVTGIVVTGVSIIVMAGVYVTLEAAPEPFPAQDANAAAAAQDKPYMMGPNRCILCHRKNFDPTKDDPSTAMCLMDESTIWKKNDKHSQAYQLLLDDLGKNMAEKLGWKIQDLSKRSECLSCHAGWHWHKDDDLMTPQAPRSYERGVTCESCHGPSSLWERQHDLPEWRSKSIEDKEATGFIDVRNPERRARQCFSCHIGDAKLGRVVTHEMYAAGHPPLPGIEIETFASEMPSHWRNLRQKQDFKHRDAFIKATRPGYAQHVATDLPQTKSVVIGGVMALRQSLQLFAGTARDSGWPELAVFDCQACHHDLKVPSPRQRLGYGNRIPGRPSISAWPSALIALGIGLGNGPGADAAAKEFADKMALLEQELNARPFGRSERIEAIVTGTDGIVPWLDALAHKLLQTSFDRGAAVSLLKQLTELPPKHYPDYNSARQIAWAIVTIHAELKGTYPEFKPLPENETLTARFEREQADVRAFQLWKIDHRKRRTVIVDQLKSYAGKDNPDFELILRLPPRVDAAAPANAPGGIVGQLQKSLEAIGHYDPYTFQGVLKQLADSGDLAL
ncbi:MAG: multiheme c-type cytochrome [Planctomycetaceae bacterium]